MAKWSITRLTALTILAACGESSGPAAATGAIVLTTLTVGANPDPDGYLVRLDGGVARVVGINAGVRYDSLAPGAHTLTLEGIAGNCTVFGSNPRSVTAIAYQAVPVEVKVFCGGPMMVPDSVEIAFVRSDGVQWDIYGIRADGSGLVNLSDHPAMESCPAWSPDGTLLAFSTDRHGNGAGEIYVVSADGTGLTRLTEHPGIDCESAWSPDGARIAFSRSASSVSFPGGLPAEFDIWVMNADGSSPVNLTRTTDQAEVHPTWSPDGTRIAFERQDLSSKTLDVYVMDADGSNVTNLTNTGSVLDREPAWSPDGAKIAFRNVRGGGDYDLWVMNANGTSPVQLTFLAGPQVQATWSPDASRIAFSDGPTIIRIINADGSGLVSVTSGANDFSPTWRPPLAARR